MNVTAPASLEDHNRNSVTKVELDSIYQITSDLTTRASRLGHTQVKVPTKATINTITKRFVWAIIPGTFNKSLETDKEVWEYVSTELKELHKPLRDQITKALRIPQKKNPGILNPEVKAREAVNAFYKELVAIRDTLSVDFNAAVVGDPSATCIEEVIAAYPVTFALAVHRLANSLYRLNIPIIPRMMAECAHGETGIDINPGAKIGRGCFIDHGTGVVIGETCVLGDFVRIYQGVGFIAKSLSMSKVALYQQNPSLRRHPSVGSGCTIYANVTLIGDITVGDNCTIAANVRLTESVPPNSLVTQDGIFPKEGFGIKDQGK